MELKLQPEYVDTCDLLIILYFAFEEVTVLYSKNERKGEDEEEEGINPSIWKKILHVNDLEGNQLQ